ncbi:MAG: cell division protein FtsA [Nitrospiraceae bacterium]|nr:cell division protein FtsA [Nitrospiraceae bacterium]
MTGQQIMVGLDVGTTKTCVVVAALRGSGAEMLGCGLAPSAGLRKGMVINIDETVDSINKAVREAESSAGVKIKSVSVGISGSHIRGFDSSGAIGIRGREVTDSDVKRAIDSARTVYIPLDRELLHTVPNEYVLDGQEGITDPVAMSGVRLEARVHIITAAVSPLQNLLKCCGRAGVEVAEVVFAPLASARAVLSKEEKEAGVIVVDIGGGTTDIVLFKGGNLRHASVIAVGGNHFTNDIAVGLRVTMKEAERLKKEAGAAYELIVASAEKIEITQAGGQQRTLPKKYLAEILQPRCEEMLDLLRDEIKKCGGYGSAVCGIVLTGGVSRLTGLDQLAEAVLGLPVRLGSPGAIRGLRAIAEAPLYAAGAGLAAAGGESEPQGTPRPDVMQGALSRMTGLVKDIFKNADHFHFMNRKEGGILCLKSRK